MQFLKIESNFQHLPSLVMVTNPNHNSQIVNRESHVIMNIMLMTLMKFKN